MRAASWTTRATGAHGPVKPRLYQCCGTENSLYADNIRFRDFVRKLPLDLTYEEGPGEHNWAYWDAMIQNVLRWMFSWTIDHGQ